MQSSSNPDRPLPIIILFERHWDKIPKQVMLNLLPVLAEEGYDTLCLEQPQDLTAAECISRVNDTVDHDENIYSTANNCLNTYNIKIDGDLSDLSQSTLIKLMQLYVSSQKYLFVADRIRHYPADKMMKEILTMTAQLSMHIECIDIDSKDYDKMNTVDIIKRNDIIFQDLDTRNTVLTKNLLKLSKKRNGVVFMCGGFHASAIISFFKENNMQNQVICYFPHSSRRYDESINDIEDIMEGNMSKDILRLLTDKHSIESFINEIIYDIRSRDKKHCQPSDALLETSKVYSCSKNKSPALFTTLDTAIELYKNAVKQYSDKKYNEAILLLEQSLQCFNDQNEKNIIRYSRCYSTMASCYRELNQIEKAIACCNTALEYCFKVTSKDSKNEAASVNDKLKILISRQNDENKSITINFTGR